MSNDEQQYGAPGEDAETGEPTGLLDQLERRTSPFFLAGVRRRIQRRTAASQLVTAWWQLPAKIFTELASMLFDIAGGDGKRKRN